MSQFIICVYVTLDAPWPVQLGADSSGEMDSGPWGKHGKSEQDRGRMKENKRWAGKEREIQKVFKFRAFLLVTKSFHWGPTTTSFCFLKIRSPKINFDYFILFTAFFKVLKHELVHITF